MAGEQHGWRPDPFAIHQLRYFSRGQPTKLVKDGGRESYDPPPTDTAPPSMTAPAAVATAPPVTTPWATPHPTARWTGWSLSAPSPAEPRSAANVALYKRPLFWIVAVVLVLAIVVAFVNTGSESPKSASPPANGARRTTTTVAPTTTTTAIPVAPQPSAQEAATALVSGWGSGNRPVALSVATTQAVATLFAVPYPGGLAIDRGCSDGAAPIVCTYGPPGGASPNDPIYSLSLLQAPRGGWYVDSVQIKG